VQAHTLGEVGLLGTILIRVYSATILPIFIEIGSYLTDKEQKIYWHSFFETRCRIIDLHITIHSFFLVGFEKLFYFCKSDVSAVHGHSRSLILVPIESAYATSY